MAKWRTKKKTAAVAGAPAKSGGAVAEKRAADEAAAEKGGGDAPAWGKEVVISVPLHCEGCARKVRRSLQRVEGVEEVVVDCATNTVVVKGRSAALDNPMMVVENVERRTGKKAVLLSSSPAKLPPRPLKNDSETKNDAAGMTTKDHLAQVDMEMVVVMRMEMHCDACREEIKRRILNIKGVEEAVLHLKSSQVMVRGAIEPATLAGLVQRCTGRKPAIIRAEPHPPAAAMEAPSTEAQAPADADAKPREDLSQGPEAIKEAQEPAEDHLEVEEKLQNEKPPPGGDTGDAKVTQPGEPNGHTVAAAAAAAAPETEKMAAGSSSYQYSYHPAHYAYAYPPCAYHQQYQYQQLHSYAGDPAAVYAYPQYPPQNFSDENPDACAIM